MALFGYLRCSTDDQAESGLGLEAQQKAIERAYGTPDAVFSDEGVSGTRADRPGLLALLETLQAGDVLAVAKRDRLSRDTIQALWWEKEVLRRGATIQAADGNGNGSSPADKLMRTLTYAFAEFERDMTASRTKAALAAKRARGEKTGGSVPYGYREVGGRLEPIAQQQALIFEALEMYDAGHSLRAIGRHLGKHPQSAKRIIQRGIRCREEGNDQEQDDRRGSEKKAS